MNKQKFEQELEYIIKSSSCTFVSYDEWSTRDYPEMIDKLLIHIAKDKAKLLVKTINYLSDELGYPKEELAEYIKQGIQGRKL